MIAHSHRNLHPNPTWKAFQTEREAERGAWAKEKRALEKLKKKQQGEIEQMLLFEIRATQAAQEKEMLREAEAQEPLILKKIILLVVAPTKATR